MTTRVLLVDDDALVRSGLELLLSGADDLVVVGTAADGDEVPAAVTATQPDVVLMDIRMPRTDGITATRRLQRGPAPPGVLVLTTFDGDPELLGALRAGAAGFLLKDAQPEQIVDAVRRVARGDPALSPEVTRRLIDRATQDVGRRDRAREAFDHLSDREREVAQELAAGRTNTEIARNLHMSVATVKAHVSHMFVKLDLTNRTQLALLARDAE